MSGRLASCLRRLLGDRSGVSAVEFALSAPLLFTAGLWGVEEANLAIVHMRVSQMASQIADNASRIGDTSVLEDRKIYERDINDLLLGSNVQAGRALDFYEHGRTFISSLEVDPETGFQYIHWQRCKGMKVVTSTYGEQGDGLDGSMPDGMGASGEKVTAEEGEAVIFVEVVYEYQPLISDRFIGDPNIHATAAFMVRDSRDLTQIYQRDPAHPDPVSSCSVHDGFGQAFT